MKKVEKSVNEAMEWMNNVMNAQAKKSLDQDPVVRAQEIRAKITPFPPSQALSHLCCTLSAREMAAHQSVFIE